MKCRDSTSKSNLASNRACLAFILNVNKRWRQRECVHVYCCIKCPFLKVECARRNAKLVANYLISDTCLNALKWPHGPSGAHTRFDWSVNLAPDLHGSTRGWRNNDLQLSFSPPPAPPRHTGRPPLTPRQRPSSSQTDSSRAIWRGAAQSLGLPLHTVRATHMHLTHIQ